MKKICFTTILDDTYILGAITMIHSLLASNKNFNYDFLILDWGNLSANNKQKLLKLYKKIKFIPVETHLYKNCLYDNQIREWSYNCNYRFDIFTFEDYEKIVFIDCDFLIQTDFTSLLKKELDFAAVPSIKKYVQQALGNSCFSAGFLVIGKKYIKPIIRDDLIKLSLSPAPKSELNTNLWTSDEPILNNYFKEFTPLPIKYNTLLCNYTPSALTKKQNIHFNGYNKPWLCKTISECFDKYTLNSFLANYGTSKGLMSLKMLLNKYGKTTDDAIAKYEL